MSLSVVGSGAEVYVIGSHSYGVSELFRMYVHVCCAKIFVKHTEPRRSSFVAVCKFLGQLSRDLVMKDSPIFEGLQRLFDSYPPVTDQYDRKLPWLQYHVMNNLAR